MISCQKNLIIPGIKSAIVLNKAFDSEPVHKKTIEKLMV